MSGKRFLVVGGSSGIGAEIVRQLISRDHGVVVAVRRPDRVATHPAIEALAWDAASGEELPSASLGAKLDGLAYCPGTIQLKPLGRLSDENYLADFQVNLLGAVRTLRSALPALRQSEAGASVVLFSTVAVGAGMPFHASVAAAKGAVEGFCRAAAAELAPAIRVNAIAPSVTATPLAERLVGNENRREAAAKRHPLGRIGEAEEVARLALALLDGEISWMSGQVLPLDGGLSSLRVS